MTQTIHVSFFKDPFASTISTADLTLEELRTRILNATAKTKADLPWLKLAVFGNKRVSKSRSLRHDANVLRITGAELDYDGEIIGFDEALEMVRAMGISALVYTSPSHTAANPRWRILAPTSQPCAPELRASLVARMNGFMNGILGKHVESFTLSQAYYYGQAQDNAAANHMAVVVEGTPIDLCAHLKQFEAAGTIKDDVAADAADNPFEGLAQERADTKPKDSGKFDEILGEMGDGPDLKGFNDPLTRAVANYVGLHNGHQFDHDTLKSLLRAAIDKAPKNPTRPITDIRRYLSDRYLSSIIKSAIAKFVESMPVGLHHFVSHEPAGVYYFTITNDPWKPKAINNRIKNIPKLKKDGRPEVDPKTGKAVTIKATKWLDRHRRVDQFTWVPGEPELIKDRVLREGAGWINQKGTNVYNTYRPPVMRPGDARDALLWLNHLRKVYPDDWEHILGWLAHRVQKPGEKINHALLLGGSQGVGKDTLLEPVRRAIGPWNFREASPQRMVDQPYTSYLKSVILRINEVRDLGEVNRFAFYDHLKTITAAPPDTLQINEKFVPEHSIVNCCGVLMTTNYRTDGIYLPPNDRRTYVAWSPIERDAFGATYWDELWDWYERGGDRNVMAYLVEYDLDAAGFKPKAPPKHTEAFKAIVMTSQPADHDDISDAIEELGNPDALCWDMLEAVANPTLSKMMEDRFAYLKKLNHRLESHGYVLVSNPDEAKGRWSAQKPAFGSDRGERVRLKIYARQTLSLRDQYAAASKLVEDFNAGKMPLGPGNKADKSNVSPFPPRKK